MEHSSSMHWSILRRKPQGVVVQMTRISSFQRRGPWTPAINAYRCRDRFVICVELAGVDRSSIQLSVLPNRLSIQGQRQAPEPPCQEGPLSQVLALEIDQGPFERELTLPAEVLTEGASAEQRNGILWIYLPLSKPTPINL